MWTKIFPFKWRKYYWNNNRISFNVKEISFITLCFAQKIIYWIHLTFIQHINDINIEFRIFIAFIIPYIKNNFNTNAIQIEFIASIRPNGEDVLDVFAVHLGSTNGHFSLYWKHRQTIKTFVPNPLIFIGFASKISISARCYSKVRLLVILYLKEEV